MATRSWEGDAEPIAQVTTLTPADVEIGDVFTATINGKSVSFTATAATVANVTEGLTAEWNDSTIPEFAEITAVDNTTKITLTHDTDGVPFTVTASSTGDGTPADTLTASTTTSATGPNFVDNAENWSGSTLPVNSDDVYVPSGRPAIKHGLDQLSAVTLNSLNIDRGVQIGLPETNEDGTTDYEEYRKTYWEISATTLTVGTGEAGQNELIKIDTGSNQTEINVLGNAQGLIQNQPTLLWKGSHASNEVNVTRGHVGIAYFPGESATVATLRVGFQENPAGDSTVQCGDGLSLTNVDQSGGSLTLDSATTLVNMTDGELTIKGGAHAAINVDGGDCIYKSTGTLTTANVGGGGSLLFNRDMRSRTVTNCTIFSGSTLLDPQKTVTWTNGIDLSRCSLSDVTLNLGTHQTLTPSAI